MKKSLQHSLWFVLLVLLLTACTPVFSVSGGAPVVIATVTPQPVVTQKTVQDAQVESVEIRARPGDASQVDAIVRGRLPDACTKLQDPQVGYQDGTFHIQLTTASPAGQGCIQVITPFEQTIALDTAQLSPGAYTVDANGISSTFSLPLVAVQSPSSLQLVVAKVGGTLEIANVGVPLNPTARPTFNGFLPYGGGASGNAYVLVPDQSKAVASDGKVFHDLEFIQNSTPFGLAVWPGNGNTPPLLAWATHNTGGDRSSTIKISAPDGTHFETLLTQDGVNPPTQLVVEFWSADGQWLYFSQEPLGLGGFIYFSGGSNLYKINITTKEVVGVVPIESPEQPQACLDSISPDFQYIAEHCSPSIIRVRNLTTNSYVTYNPPAEIMDGQQLAGSARFSPDGKMLAYAVAEGFQDASQGWVVLSDTALDNSHVILASQPASYYNVVGWLDDQTLLIEQHNTLDCKPLCESELLTIKTDGTQPQKVADGTFLAMVPNEAVIQLPAEPLPTTPPTTACTDAAEYIHDDGLDGKTYPPNTAFMKTWTVKNTGTCTWDGSYLVYQISGEFMTQQPGYWLVPQGQTVEPGQTVDIVVGLTSPPMKGNYTSYWGIKNEAGEIIPIKGGSNGNSFYVDVNVNAGTVETGAVTATAIDIVPEQGSGDACTADSTYLVHAAISTDGPATTSYEIGSSAGQIAAGSFDQNGQLSPYVNGALTFEQAGTQTVNLRFVGPYPYPDNIRVMLRVNGGEWVSASVTCP